MRKLSVIVAVYNAEQYIGRCLDSIISQDADVEIVVVNDGSTDKTSEILEEFKDKIKLITLSKNGGSVSIPRNIGLDNASGEFITFCDADDWYKAGAFEKIFKTQSETNADIVKFPYVRVYPDGTEKPMPKAVLKDVFVEKGDFCREVYPYFINGINLNSVWSAVFKREIIENLRFPSDFKTAEDAVFALDAYTNAQSVAFCPEPLYCYYQNSTGLTGSGLKLYKKYKYNFMFAKKTLGFLPKWGMNTIAWRIKTVLRPVKLTFDKISRMLK